MYEYSIANIRVVDGDTVDCDIDLGFDSWLHKQRIRLFGIDAPETRTKDLVEKQAGLACKKWLETEIMQGQIQGQITLLSEEYDRGKFGRILGSILVTVDGTARNLNDEMLKYGLAKPYFGGAR